MRCHTPEEFRAEYRARLEKGRREYHNEMAESDSESEMDVSKPKLRTPPIPNFHSERNYQRIAKYGIAIVKKYEEGHASEQIRTKYKGLMGEDPMEKDRPERYFYNSLVENDSDPHHPCSPSLLTIRIRVSSTAIISRIVISAWTSMTR